MGLYYMNDNMPKPACKYVQDALFDMIECDNDDNNYNNILKVICGNKAMQPVALEIFAARGFKNRNQLRYIDKIANPPDVKSMKYAVSNMIYSNREQEIESIHPGTLIVCYRHHKAIDFVLYSTDEVMIFVQVSTTCYQNHGTKRDDVFSEQQGEFGERIYGYYTKRALTTNGNTKWSRETINEAVVTKTFLRDTYYCYVTNTSLKKQGNIDGIMLIAREHLDCLGKAWKYF
jgi:hypothetical protein